MDKPSRLRPISEEILADRWGKLTEYTFDFRHRDGQVQRQSREVYRRGDGTTCLLYDPETGCVLLTRQFRMAAFKHSGKTELIEAPAGFLDGEASEARMRAELIEETGYSPQNLRHLFDIFMNPGAVAEKTSFFAGTYSKAQKTGAGGGEFEEGEDIEVLHVPLDEALSMIETGEICDAKTIILLQNLIQQVSGQERA